MTSRALALVGLLSLALAAPAAAMVHGGGSKPLPEQIRDYRAATWKWEAVMGKPRTPPSLRERKGGVARLVEVRDRWKRRAVQARREAQRPPHLEAWLCIHSYEGAWNDPGAPYYGGLQMDISFQSAYGSSLLQRKGTADNWTPLEQMWVAEKALAAGRGFYPWPNAARLCGLI
jgi:hypothetical protein